MFLATNGFEHFITLSISALAALFLLKLLENISAFRLIKKPSDSFVLTSAFITGTVALNRLFNLTNKTNLQFQLSEPQFYGLSSLVLIGYGISIYMLIRYDRKRKVALYLDSDESSLLQNTLRSNKNNKNNLKLVTFISKKELKECILKNDLSGIDLIIISRETVKNFDVEAVLIKAHLAGIPIIDLKDVNCKSAGRIDTNETDLSTYLLSATQKTLIARITLQIRYMLEPVLALLMIILLLPLAALVAIGVKLTSPGPVFYRQLRCGHSGKIFKLIKFRSMRQDAESNGPQWCGKEDNRITKFGNFMRRTRLDELPQLWNIMCGEMSFVGPRPERPEIYKKLEAEIPLFTLRNLVRPGVTGWAQINSGYAATNAESLLKLEFDLFYIQHMSLSFDLLIVLKTIKVALFGDEGADENMLKNLPENTNNNLQGELFSNEK